MAQPLLVACIEVVAGFDDGDWIGMFRSLRSDHAFLVGHGRKLPRLEQERPSIRPNRSALVANGGGVTSSDVADAGSRADR